MTTPFLHPITGIYHFHQCSSLCFSQKQIEGIKRYMQILSFFITQEEDQNAQTFHLFSVALEEDQSNYNRLRELLVSQNKKRRILSRKIMEILIQEDDHFINQNQSITHQFLEDQFTEYTKDLKKVTNFRRTNN